MSARDSAQRYRQAKDIAMVALDLPRTERDAWAQQQCGEDRELLEEVRWLIDSAEDDAVDEVPEQFHQATEQALRQVSLQVPLPRDYRLLRRISQGGMGIVYLAERIDGEIRQQVALKLLHVGDTPDEVLSRRFATEQHILSRLNHPNVAHLIDAGLTAEGRPFMATEFVDGQAIDQWCRMQRSSLNERLELLLKVCDAVDYAHRHMVIHRDLKPGNILVTPEGEPKLLDFGIARLIDVPEAGEERRPGSGPVARALTLAYASPEQIEGRDLSVATDVYSLGVVFYELLTGNRPFADTDDPDAVSMAIVAGRFPAPSSHPAPGINRISRDLDAIVFKAMQADPEARYESARALAEDVRAMLDRRPVRARGGGAAYVASRFIWRQRWAVSATVVLFALLSGFLIDRESQLQRIAWERDRAEAVTEFMNELFAGADSLPSRGNEVTVREILDMGTEQLVTTDSYSPALLGSMYLAIGRAYNGLGLGEQALPLLREAQRALGPAIRLEERARIQAEIGAALDTAGRAVEAIAADQRAMELLRKVPSDVSEDVMRVRIRRLRNHANVVDVPLQDTIAGLHQIIEELDARRELPAELRFEAMSALVGAYVFSNQPQAALQTAEAALALAEQLYAADDPRRLRGRYVHANALLLSDPDRAVELYSQLVDDHERLIGTSQRLANMIGNFGVALSRAGRNPESMEAFARAADMIEELAGRDHYLFRLSVSNLAALHLRAGEPEEAERLIREIIDEVEWGFDQYGGVESMYRASALDILGSSLVIQARFEEAVTVYREALELLETNAAGEWTELTSTIASRLAEVERELE
jgi:eukaryotic-like serine/threonine-protein kinase